jgi:hypothetical protein
MFITPIRNINFIHELFVAYVYMNCINLIKNANIKAYYMLIQLYNE